jgi:hypothetical protein
MTKICPVMSNPTSIPRELNPTFMNGFKDCIGDKCAVYSDEMQRCGMISVAEFKVTTG